VVLAITAGLVTAGIPGALLAVPLLAVLNAGIRSLLHEVNPDPENVDVLADKAAQPNDDKPLVQELEAGYTEHKHDNKK
jgi:hypothetical protein